MSMFINRNWVALQNEQLHVKRFCHCTHMQCMRCVCAEKARYQCHKSFYFSLHFSDIWKEGSNRQEGSRDAESGKRVFFLYFGTFMLSFDLFKCVIHKAIFRAEIGAAKSMEKSFTEERRIRHFPFNFFMF